MVKFNGELSGNYLRTVQRGGNETNQRQTSSFEGGVEEFVTLFAFRGLMGCVIKLDCRNWFSRSWVAQNEVNMFGVDAIEKRLP